MKIIIEWVLPQCKKIYYMTQTSKYCNSCAPLWSRRWQRTAHLPTKADRPPRCSWSRRSRERWASGRTRGRARALAGSASLALGATRSLATSRSPLSLVSHGFPCLKVSEKDREEQTNNSHSKINIGLNSNYSLLSLANSNSKHL